MPLKTPDRRRREDLELFLLALIDRGVNSPYALMDVASLSPGATIPALSRLEKSNWVKKGEEQARKRAEYSLTQKGRHHLENRWRSLFSLDPIGEIETVLRTASLACLMGAPNRSVKAYLLEAARLRGAGHKNRRISASAPKTYAHMKQVADSKRLVSEVSALRAIAKSLKK